MADKKPEFNSRSSMYYKCKHVYFRRQFDRNKTDTWICVNIKNFDEIGKVKWFPRWNQYCFFPQADTVYSASCLGEIQDFVKNLQIEYKTLRKLPCTDTSDVVLDLKGRK